MTYTQTIEYLYEQLPMFSRIGAKAYKADLDNIKLLCSALGNPEHKFKSIHIAGTNGKGSTSHTLAAILQKAGYKTGLYTSPHLVDFRERIRIDGEMIPKQYATDFVAQYKSVFEDVKPSFFEWGVALAFDYFSKEKVDIAVIETGLGGRLDSTNIILPQVSVITNIGYDHQQFLGDTLKEIAGEKAGIIKQNTPVVIGEYHTETVDVFANKAAEQKSPTHLAYKNFDIKITDSELDTLSINVQSTVENGYNGSLILDLAGKYQCKNIATTLQTVAVLRNIGYTITDDVLIQAVKDVKGLTGLQGRWQKLQSNPTVIVDTGHNTHGLQYTMKQLTDIQYDKLHIILGMVADKEIDSALKLFPKDAIYYFTNANIPRALAAGELAEHSKQFGLAGNIYQSIALAKEAALKNAKENDVVFVGGSTFVVGEYLASE